jgi:RNA polymerase sigma factor (sigma-70 family)
MIQQSVPSIVNFTDAELLELYLQAGNQDAFAEVVRRNEHAVLRVCRQILRSTVDIDDAFQATFLVLLRRAREVRWQPSLRGWLVSVAHRIAVRSQAGQKRTSVMLEEPTDNQSSNQQSDLSWREACQVLHQELNQLKDQFRLPLLLCYLQGYSRDEAAQLLGCSMGSVKANLERGRKLLRLRLEQRGITLTAGLLTLLARPLTSEALTKPVSLYIQTILQGNASVRAMAFARSATVSGGLWAVRVSLSILVLMMGTIAWVGWQSGKLVASTNTLSPSLPVIEAMQKGSTATEEMAEVTGTVVDQAGKPLGNVEVNIAKINEPWKPLKIQPWTTTDEAGRFRGKLPAQNCMLVAQKHGFGLDYLMRGTDQLKEPVRLQLREEMPISGKVVDEQQRPVAGAKVRLRFISRWNVEQLEKHLKQMESTGNQHWMNDGVSLYTDSADLFSTTTDAQGQFRLLGLPAGSLAHLTISHAKLVTQSPYVVLLSGFGEPRGTAQLGVKAERVQEAYLKVVAGDSRESRQQTEARLKLIMGHRVYEPAQFQVTMPVGIALSGTVRDLQGKPVAGVRVSTYSGASSEGTTDAEGRYTLDGLSASENYTVQSYPTNRYLAATASAVHRDAGPIRIDLQLRPGTILKGKVLDGKTGKGVRAQIEIQPMSGNPLLNKHNLVGQVSTITNADGIFRSIAPPCDVIVTAQVYDEAPLEPNPYVAATILPNHSQLLNNANPRQGAVSVTGTNNVIHLRDAYQIVELPAEGETELELTLVRGKERTIRLIDPEGKPVDGASIVGVDFNNVLYTLKQSTAQVAGLTASEKERHVYALDRDKKLGAFAVLDTASTEPVTIQLQPLASYQARLVGSDGKPLQGIELVLSFAGKPGQGWNAKAHLHFSHTAISDANGQFKFSSIIPGSKYWLMKGTPYSSSSLTPNAKVIELKPGENRNGGDIRLTKEQRGR